MFRNAKVGERVWHIRNGYAPIAEVEQFTVGVMFDNGEWYSFTLDGKEDSTDLNPTLFWDEIKFEVPKKPFDLEREYRKLERKEFHAGEDNFYLWYDHTLGIWYPSLEETVEYFGNKHFKNNTTNFTELLNEHKITPKQLEEVIRKVEREEQE